MENEEVIHHEMEKTRASLAEKLEALEGQVGSTVTSTTEAVQNTTETVQQTVQQTVETVKETVEHVTEKVEEVMTAASEKFQETVQAVSETFNLSRQFERHPWLVMGGAVTVGCILANVINGSQRGRRESYSPSQPAFQPSYSNPSSGSSYSASTASSSGSSGDGNTWVNEGLSHLKDVAISYLMGVVRDLAKRELPEAISGRVAEGVDDVTRKMGAQPIQGEVLPAAQDNESSQSSQNDEGFGSKRGGRQSKVGASR